MARTTISATQRQILAVEKELSYNQLFRYKPYPKQQEFHHAGAEPGVKERLLIAGNQLGKTLSASRETAMHLTGLYPQWWTGARFRRATTGWAASLTSQGTRDTVQRLLLGPPGNFGTGAIPKKSILDVKKATHGVADAVETIWVRHEPTGDTSRLTLKTYDQGRERWQGDTLNFCIAEGQRVQMADGRFIPIETVQPGEKVRTVDGRGRAVVREVAAVHDRGTKDIVEVETSRGPWMRMTPDHEVYVDTRTKRAVEDADYVTQVPGDWEPEVTTDDLPEAMYAWAGLVVAEGSVSCRKITMAPCPAVETAIAMLPQGARVRCKKFDDRHEHVPDWFLSWPEFWGRIPAGLAHEKEVPEWVFTAPNHRIATFLSYLYAGDGWASGHTIGYASTSRVLAEQVSALLWRLGIRTSVMRKPATAKWREQWMVYVSFSDHVLRFAERIGIIGKEDALEKVCREARRRVASKKTRGARRPVKRPEDARAKSREANGRTRDRFARIHSVTPAGKARVYDLSIEEDHRFVVGTAVVSNCWFDEEPPMDIYTEGLTRLIATGGIAFMTFTPLLGMSAVVRRFLQEKPPGTHVTKMTIDDAGHFTPEERAAIIARWPEHERDARARGVPMLGGGRVYPIPEGDILEPAIQIPEHWPRIAGIDFGWDHPTAVVWLAWDRDNDVVHLYDAYRRKEATPIVHAAALRARGQWIPVAWPHDGLNTEKGSGIILAQQYRDQGANMLKVKATHPPAKMQKEGDGGNGVEAGLQRILDRMLVGKFKVARHLNDWLEEFRMYHRENGLVVKEMDDLMDATRYAEMMLRFAKTRVAPRQVVVPGFRPYDSGMGALG